MKLLLIMAFMAFQAVSGLRFAHQPVTVDTDVLIVNRPARLTCNYVKFRTEAVRDIKWLIGYGGFNAQIFHYAVTTGKKEGSQYTFINVDEASVTESELTITLTDFRDSNMTLGCEVEVIRDNGYGKMRHSKKIGESSVKVIDNDNHQLLVKPDPEQGRTAQPGRDFTFSCISKGAQPAPTLSLMVNGQNVSEMSRTRVQEFDSSSGNYDRALVAKIEDLPDSLFRDDYLQLECLAHYDNFLFAQKEITLNRKEPDTNGYVSSYRPPSSSSNRRNEDDSEYMAQKYHGSSSQNRFDEENDDLRERENGGRQGRVDHDEQAHDADHVHARILDMIDPARHVHPGVPYDFFAGYVLLVSESLNEHAAASVTLWGELPYAVEAELTRGYGQLRQLGGGGKARIDMDAIKVLNALGQTGYRVIAGSANGKEGGYVWTLERRNFDIQQKQQGRQQEY